MSAHGTDPLERYLAELAEELSRLGACDVDDTVAEMRSHLEDTLAASPESDAQAVLTRLGEPASLAAKLVAERTAGEREAGPARASAVRRGVSWLADLVWALWPAALLWPVIWLAAALLGATLSPLGLLLTPGALPQLLAVLAATAFGLGWPVWRLIDSVRFRKTGRQTLGTRAANIVPIAAPGRALWIAAEDAHSAGVPGVTNRARATTAVVVAALILVAGASWLPLATAGQRLQQASFEDAARYDETRMQAYQSAAEGWVRDIYTAALEGTMDELANKGDRGFSASPATLQSFAEQTQAESVSAWSLGLYDVPPVALDPAKPDRATVAIPVNETTPEGVRVATVRFEVIDPQQGSSGADEQWRLVAVDRDELRGSSEGPPAAEARESVNLLLGLGGYSPPDTGDRSIDAPKRMTPEFARSDQGALLTNLFWADDPSESIGENRAILRVEYEGGSALVYTAEEWVTNDPSNPEQRHYVYTVVPGEPNALVSARTRVENAK